MPRWGASNEYPQHMFLMRNKKNIDILLKKAPYQELCCWLFQQLWMKLLQAETDEVIFMQRNQLTFCMLGKNFSRQSEFFFFFFFFFFFSEIIAFLSFCIHSNYKAYFLGKTRNHIVNLSPAELAQSGNDYIHTPPLIKLIISVKFYENLP